MPYGTIIMSSFGDRDVKLNAIKKIFEKFGFNTFTSNELNGVLNKKEKALANMNKWRYANIVTRSGWDNSKRKCSYRRLWRLTQGAVELMEKGVCC